MLGWWLLGQEVCGCLDRIVLELFDGYIPVLVPAAEGVRTHDQRLQRSGGMLKNRLAAIQRDRDDAA